MRLHVLDCGVIRMPINAIMPDVSSGADRETMIDIPVESFLFECDPEFILFDAACDPEGMDGRWPEAFRANPYLPGSYGGLLGCLSALGVAPERIGTVVASHLHLDHAGCLKYFPHARVHVHGSELARTLKAFFRGGALGAHVPSDIEGWLDAELRWQPILDDVAEVALTEGLSIINFGPGHSWGMLGMYAELPRSGPFLFVSDAAYTPASFGPEAPLPAFLEDEAGYRSTIERIKRLAAERQARIVCGHDPGGFRDLVALGAGGLE